MGNLENVNKFEDLENIKHLKSGTFEKYMKDKKHINIEKSG